MSQEILAAIRRKNRLWKHVKDGRPADEYKILDARVKKMIRTAKRKFEQNLAKGGSSRPFYK